VYLVVDGVKYWIMLGPSGPTLYRREGSKTKYLGRRPLEAVKRLLALAGAEALQKIKSDVEAVKQALERQRPAQTAQAPSLTWRKDGHTYWILQYGTSFYIYVKGSSTRHKPRLIEKTDVTGVISRVVAAGAVYVLEALRLVVYGLYSAVADLLRPQPQVSRREAEEALVALRRGLRREVAAWREKYRLRMEREGLYEVDPRWVRKDLAEFLRENRHLLEKILPHRDLVNDLADAVEEETYGYLTRSDVLETLNQL
jgi:transposase InsO family protein